MTSRPSVSRHLSFTSIAIAALMAATSWAGTTGKVSGSVTDPDGEPIPGAAVTVNGTRLGASTDADGRYIILQVPPGEHVLTAQIIGYNPTTVTEVRVSADLTSRVEFRLGQEAIEMEGITVTAERPPIEVDVTSSRVIVDAERVSEVPVNQMLDVLHYQPGVAVARDNELVIRGGGPSEIRFQVDGVDRTDGVTGKGYTQINQVLVSEVTLLTGGFNAEYGNVRSGMVNVIVKEGSERGSLRPWFAGVAAYAPTQRKHFGPGAYDQDQYDYWVLTQSDSARTGGPILWPDFYEVTRNDTAFMSFVATHQATHRAHSGWNERVERENAKILRQNPAFGHNGWTASDMREAWEYQANMNEQVWTYADKPDITADLAVGWGLPNRLGGIILGYRVNREMTTVPAIRPYYRDESIESKITLTPTDRLKLNVSYMTARSRSTGAASGEGGAIENREFPRADVGASDPVSLRDTGQLIGSLNESANPNTNNRIHYSANSPLDGSFTTVGASITYSLDASTFLSATFGHSTSDWDLRRDLPMADSREGAWDPETAEYNPPAAYDYGAFLAQLFTWTPGDSSYPVDIDYATNPDNYWARSPFLHPNAYNTPPRETRFASKEFTWANRSWEPPPRDRENLPVADTTYVVDVVSPQGWWGARFTDLAGRFTVGEGGKYTMSAGGVQGVARTDITHVRGDHTMKAGAELLWRDLRYLNEVAGNYISAGVGGGDNSEMRDYGGDYPAAQPKIFGAYIQDKYESDGMIANLGLRAERFDAGQRSWFYDDMFNGQVLGKTNSVSILQQLVVDAGLDTSNADYDKLYSNPATNWFQLEEILGEDTPLPHDVVNAWPSSDNAVHWRVAPRLGISHPVALRTKLFFNYGIFYSMQKPIFLYGYRIHDGRPGGTSGRIDYLYNPNLRPARTTMYEVGIEHVLPFRTVFKIAGYAKYNDDQVTAIEISESAGISGYTIYRNANWEDVRGLEIQIARTSGRFVNGMLTYEFANSRTGEVGFTTINEDPSLFATTAKPFVRAQPARGSLRVFVRVGTPLDWGALRGGWSVGTVYSRAKGGTSQYNPNNLPQRELPEENYIPWRDTWNADMKFTKQIPLPAGRFASIYLDVTNVFNRKWLSGSGVSDFASYAEYVFNLRGKGQDVSLGDKSTLHVLSEPYKFDENDAEELWKAPISPQVDWIRYLNPRYYRFGVRLDL